MGLDARGWGSAGWHFMHSVAITFPSNPSPEQLQEYKNFFYSLASVLPCELCRGNFQKKITENPPPFDNGKNMFYWTVDLHNAVNQQNGKKVLDYEEAYREYYENTQKYTNGIYVKDIPSVQNSEKVNVYPYIFVSLIIGLSIPFLLKQAKLIK